MGVDGACSCLYGPRSDQRNQTPRQTRRAFSVQSATQSTITDRRRVAADSSCASREGFDTPVGTARCRQPVGADNAGRRAGSGWVGIVREWVCQIKKNFPELVCHCEEGEARRGNPFPFSRSNNVPVTIWSTDCHTSVRTGSQ